MTMFDGFDKVLVGLVSIGVGSRSVGGIVDGCMLKRNWPVETEVH